MSDRVKYEFSRKGMRGRQRAQPLDPRLVALVRFLARRAAERDYDALLKKHARARNGSKGKEGSE